MAEDFMEGSELTVFFRLDRERREVCLLRAEQRWIGYPEDRKDE